MMNWLRRWLGLDEGRLVRLRGGLGQLDGEMLQELLRDAGIPSVVKSSDPLDAYMEVDGLGKALWVRAGDAARAEEVLALLDEDRTGPC